MTKQKLEEQTWCGASFKAWTDAAREAGLVLRAPDGLDSGDYPERIYSGLRHFRRAMALAKAGVEPTKIVTHMHRQLVSERDEKGRPVKREYLTWTGRYEVTDHRGVPYHVNLEVGKYDKPKIVINPSRKFNPDTGEPIGPEKIFSGQETIYTIPMPDKKEARKKLIDSIIGDNFAEEIKYYYKDPARGRRDSTYSYSDFYTYSIEELASLSAKGGGSKSPGIWRDPRDGKLRDRDSNLAQ